MNDFMTSSIVDIVTTIVIETCKNFNKCGVCQSERDNCTIVELRMTQLNTAKCSSSVMYIKIKDADVHIDTYFYTSNSSSKWPFHQNLAAPNSLEHLVKYYKQLNKCSTMPQ